MKTQPSAGNSVRPRGEFFVEHLRHGEVINSYRIPNGVLNAGKNSILDTNFHNGTQYSRWFIGLIDSVGYSTLSDIDTYQAINLYSSSFAGLPAWRYYWKYRKRITIDYTNVGADDLVDFPLCVKINADSDMAAALATGYDIRFSAVDGTTLLNYEREYWVGGGGSAVTAVIWVEIPLISHTEPTDFYIYYGNPNAPDGAAPTSVWSTDYKGVWHLSETGTGTAGDYNDSTINANDSTSTTRQPTRNTGVLGYGESFDSNQSITIPNNTSLTVADVTVEAWVNPTNSTDANLVGYDNGYVLEIGRQTDSKIGLYLYLNAGWRAFDFQYPISLSEWTWLVATYNSATGDAMLYANGQWYATINYAGNYPITHSTGTGNAIGGYTTSLFFTGSMDEVRVSSAVKTADLLNFEYLNITSNTNELTWYPQAELTALQGNNWLECTSYVDTTSNSAYTRPMWNKNASSSQTITNTIKTLYTIAANCTINGLFLVCGPTAQTKGDKSADNVIWATAEFTGTGVVLEATDQLQITYSIYI